MHCETLFTEVSRLSADGTTLTGQAVAVAAGKIQWCGAMTSLPQAYRDHAGEVIDCQGKLLTPGLIDCHTHLVYAGDRATEFQMRMAGQSYSAIAKAGGGINSTVRETRRASEEALFEQSLPRFLALAAEGVTTIEIKSGYGLDLDSEIKMLRVARKLGDATGVAVKTSFLGAHAVPPEYQGRSSAYVDFICQEMLPAIAEAGLADYVDVFCENIAFNLTETRKIFETAHYYQLAIKCHAEQLSDMGAAELAAAYGALSCDHLEYLSEAGADAMAFADTTAVLLPGAFYFLKETRQPPMDLLRQKGIGMAVASDANPGSSPTASLLLMMSMACRFFSMTVEEVWAGVTFQAAKALGIAEETGEIAVGKAADLNLWSVEDSAFLAYSFAYPIEHRTMIAGKWVQQQTGNQELSHA